MASGSADRSPHRVPIRHPGRQCRTALACERHLRQVRKVTLANAQIVKARHPLVLNVTFEDDSFVQNTAVRRSV
jgi:hypothetical protein